MNDPAGRPSVTRVCPTHGLRFDPQLSDGCIRCRTSARPAPSTGRAARPLALAALLVAVLIAAFFTYERFGKPKPTARAFTDQQVIEEARHLHVAIYSATWCPSCDAAKTFLWQNSIPFEEHDIDKDKSARDRWETLNPKKTIPVIDVEGTVVVGADAPAVVRALTTVAERRLAATVPAPAD